MTRRHIARIHIDQHTIKANINKPSEELLPPISVQTSKGVIKAFSVHINGPAELIYRPKSPLSCGARLWIETSLENLTINTTEPPDTIRKPVVWEGDDAQR